MLFLDQVLLYYKRQMCEHPPYWTLGFLLSCPPFLHLHTIWTLSLSCTSSFQSAARWFWTNKKTWSKNKQRVLFSLKESYRGTVLLHGVWKVKSKKCSIPGWSACCYILLLVTVHVECVSVVLYVFWKAEIPLYHTQTWNEPHHIMRIVTVTYFFPSFL